MVEILRRDKVNIVFKHADEAGHARRLSTPTQAFSISMTDELQGWKVFRPGEKKKKKSIRLSERDAALRALCGYGDKDVSDSHASGWPLISEMPCWSAANRQMYCCGDRRQKGCVHVSKRQSRACWELDITACYIHKPLSSISVMKM